MPPYNRKMRPKGRERIVARGERRRDRKERRREVERVAAPEAFSIIELDGGGGNWLVHRKLKVGEGDWKRDCQSWKKERKEGTTYRSIIEITGATSTAAEAALTRSAPSRRPRFLVFHFVLVVAIPSAAALDIEAVGFVSTTSPPPPPPPPPRSAARVFCVCVARLSARCECGDDVVVLSPETASAGPWTGTGAGVPSFIVEEVSVACWARTGVFSTGVRQRGG